MGYKLNQRASLQIGLAYGGSKNSGSWDYKDAGGATVTTYEEQARTRVIAIPVAGKFIFFNIERRFPIYGTATLMLAWGFTGYTITETKSGGETSYKAERCADMNIFATAGIGVNYKISQRFTGYAEFLPFKYNISSHNSFHYDWEQYSPKGRRIFKSLGIGVNYNF